MTVFPFPFDWIYDFFPFALHLNVFLAGIIVTGVLYAITVIIIVIITIIITWLCRYLFLYSFSSRLGDSYEH